ncbi:hypothetical protein EIKCOROL_01464 [Eikenella corrodens ATCC 23834]|uniref:Uncharacterized protein n=1 Tax=Eikenella corrodens ATCC 23834 TaxID=546274 RepID=C0DVS3_EIKCO|nr:hypothetical protein EIKCOROL_01464 [Eikenella corrodens ATCC 23834]
MNNACLAKIPSGLAPDGAKYIRLPENVAQRSFCVAKVSGSLWLNKRAGWVGKSNVPHF